jgi:hypothetical protein
MSKIKDFLSAKLSNFKVFIDQQFTNLKTNGVDIGDSKITNIKNDIEAFEADLNQFVMYLSYLEGREIDDSVKIFLLKYDIDIEAIKPHIDYVKLKRYIELFMEITSLK